jgi:hypothetical protein
MRGDTPQPLRGGDSTVAACRRPQRERGGCALRMGHKCCSANRVKVFGGDLYYVFQGKGDLSPRRFTGESTGLQMGDRTERV